MFTRTDEASAGDWQNIRRAERGHRGREATAVLNLVRALDGITDGFAVSQLDHALQTATRAEDDGASPALIVAALVHDVAKPFALVNHPAIAAEILRGRVDDRIVEAVKHHGEFLSDYSHDCREAHDRYRRESWCWYAKALAWWDQLSFDPEYPTLPLGHFAPIVVRVFTA